MISPFSRKHFLQRSRSYLRMSPIWQRQRRHSRLSLPNLRGWVLQSRLGMWPRLIEYQYYNTRHQVRLQSACSSYPRNLVTFGPFQLLSLWLWPQRLLCICSCLGSYFYFGRATRKITATLWFQSCYALYQYWTTCGWLRCLSGSSDGWRQVWLQFVDGDGVECVAQLEYLGHALGGSLSISLDTALLWQIQGISRGSHDLNEIAIGIVNFENTGS